MVSPERWPLVIGVALAAVALVGLVQVLLQNQGGFAWVIVGVAAVSSAVALVIAFQQRGPRTPGR